MSDISLSDLGASAGTNTGDFLKDAGNQVANAACQLYRNYPQFVVGNPFSTTGVEQSFGTGLMNSLCKDRPPGLPPPPSQQASGGQCPTLYTVTFTYHRTLKGGDPAGESINISTQCYGPIKGIAIEELPDNNSYGTVVECSDSSGQPFKDIPATLNKDAGTIDSITNVVYTRVDGQPDNCGNAPPVFPSTFPPTSVTNTNVLVPQPGGFPSISVPLLFAPINGSLNVKVSLNPNINFNFDLGGLTLNFPNKGGGQDSGNITDIVNNINSTVNSTATTANSVNSTVQMTNNTVNNVSNTVNQIQKSVDPPSKKDDSTRYTRVTATNILTRKRTGLSNFDGIFIDVTTKPINTTSIEAGDAGTRTFGGYVQFTYGTRNGAKIQINYLSNGYPAFPGCDGYSIVMEPGWVCTVTEVYKIVS